MRLLAIIGGTGFGELDGLQICDEELVNTPYGEPSNALIHGRIKQAQLIFLPRHGSGHQTPPHLINYRANIWALKQKGVSAIIAIAAVGGISRNMLPGTLIIPNQLIDYTYGREHTFCDANFNLEQHIEFTEPYDAGVRKLLLESAAAQRIACIDGACYGVTQGPRLETAAEIQRLQQDGCDIVGMTAMPEAALARELNLPYANCAVVANWAAGKSDEVITSEAIVQTLEQGMRRVLKLLNGVVDLID